MKRLFVRFGLVSLTVAFTFATVAATGNQGSRFLGIWGGIDPGDGSSQQFLISAGENGEFNLSWHETFWFGPEVVGATGQPEVPWFTSWNPEESDTNGGV